MQVVSAPTAVSNLDPRLPVARLLLKIRESVPSLLRHTKKDSDFYDNIIDLLVLLPWELSDIQPLIEATLHKSRDHPDVARFLYKWHRQVGSMLSSSMLAHIWRDVTSPTASLPVYQEAVGLLTASLMHSVPDDLHDPELGLRPDPFTAHLATALDSQAGITWLKDKILAEGDLESQIVIWEAQRPSCHQIEKALIANSSIRLKGRLLAIIEKWQLPIPNLDDWDLVRLAVARNPKGIWDSVQLSALGVSEPSRALELLVVSAKSMPCLSEDQEKILLSHCKRVLISDAETERGGISGRSGPERKELELVLKALNRLASGPEPELRTFIEVCLPLAFELGPHNLPTLVRIISTSIQLCRTTPDMEKLSAVVSKLGSSNNPDLLEAAAELAIVCLGGCRSAAERHGIDSTLWKTLDLDHYGMRGLKTYACQRLKGLYPCREWDSDEFLDANERLNRSPAESLKKIHTGNEAGVHKMQGEDAEGPRHVDVAMEVLECLDEQEPLSEDEMWDFPMDCYD